MSIIIARSTSSCSQSGGSSQQQTACLPAITIQKWLEPLVDVVVDELTTVQALAIKWYIILTTSTGTKSRSFEISAVNVNGVPRYTIYGVMGDPVNVSIAPVISAGSFKLQATSAEIDPIIVYATRLYVPPSTVTRIDTNVVNIEQQHALIPAGATTSIDTISTEHNIGVKWIVTMIDELKNRRTAQVFSLPDLSMCTAYGLLGSTFSQVTFDINTTAHTTSLVVTNGLTTAVSADIVRIPITPTLPSACDRTSDVDVWIPPYSTIPANTVGVVDAQVPVPGHAAVKWLVVVTSGTTRQIFELVADRYKLTSASYVVYGIVGDIIDVTANVELVGMNMVLSIANNTNSTITINTIRVPVAV